MTLREALVAATARLQAAGIEQPRLDASLLLSDVTGLSRTALLARDDRLLTDAEAARFEAHVAARLARRPVAKIVGRKEFWSLEFAVNDDVLDPRPDSETLVAAVLARCPDRLAALRLLDLGTGSGCLLLALLSELPNAQGLGCDISERALAVARGNAERLGLASRVRMIRSDWAEAATGTFDVVISNPPYLTADELRTVEPEVAKFDPAGALDGGPDGLAAYRRILPALAGLMTRTGRAFLECGAGQAEQLAAELPGSGLVLAEVHRDLAGHARCLELRRDG